MEKSGHPGGNTPTSITCTPQNRAKLLNLVAGSNPAGFLWPQGDRSGASCGEATTQRVWVQAQSGHQDVTHRLY